MKNEYTTKKKKKNLIIIELNTTEILVLQYNLNNHGNLKYQLLYINFEYLT